MANAEMGYGGGIYLGSGTLACNNSTINSNMATYDGGGIYAGDRITAFDDNTVSSNTSMLGDGGGIYVA